jgi:hypothetical protein
MNPKFYILAMLYNFDVQVTDGFDVTIEQSLEELTAKYLFEDGNTVELNLHSKGNDLLYRVTKYANSFRFGP